MLKPIPLPFLTPDLFDFVGEPLFGIKRPIHITVCISLRRPVSRTMILRAGYDFLLLMVACNTSGLMV